MTTKSSHSRHLQKYQQCKVNQPTRCARSKTEKEKIAKHGSLTHVCNFFTPVTFLQIYTADPGLCFLPTSCAAGVSICPYRRVPLGTLASSATGGRRALPLILLVLRLLRTTSTLGPPTSSRRMAHGGAGAVAPSAALVLY